MFIASAKTTAKEVLGGDECHKMCLEYTIHATPMCKRSPHLDSVSVGACSEFAQGKSSLTAPLTWVTPDTGTQKRPQAIGEMVPSVSSIMATRSVCEVFETCWWGYLILIEGGDIVGKLDGDLLKTHLNAWPLEKS